MSETKNPPIPELERKKRMARDAKRLRPDGELIPRAIASRVVEALSESRAVAVLGPRQAGKTTLVRDLVHIDPPPSYFTLDDAATRNAAQSDPTGFVDQMGRHSIIDEVQRVPDLLLSLKERLDRDQRPGQFLLTGSANIQTLPTIRDALPGRTDYVYLWPLAQCEIERDDRNLVDTLFAGSQPPEIKPADRLDVVRRIAAGGFPGAFVRSPKSRTRFFEAYVDSLIGRDVPEVARTRDATNVGRLLRLLASRSASLLSREGLAGDLGVDRKTVDHYLSILQDLMLVRIHQPWRSNLSSREVKTPKVYMTDTGMLAALVGADRERIANDIRITGMTFETFAVTEFVKLATWANATVRVFHYRDHDSREVDVVLERADGDIVGVEVKAAATVTPSDFRSLNQLREKSGPRFRNGIVLYTGRLSLPFGDRLSALPFSALW